MVGKFCFSASAEICSNNPAKGVLPAVAGVAVETEFLVSGETICVTPTVAAEVEKVGKTPKWCKMVQIGAKRKVPSIGNN